MSVFRSLSLATILTASSVIAHAQAASPEVVATITQYEKAINDALVKGDLTPVAPHIADTLILTNPSGGLDTKASTMELVKSGRLKYTSTAMSDIKVMQFGNTAIFTYMSTDAGTINGHDLTGKYRWTNVWVKMGSQWMAVAIQGTPIESLPPK